MKIIQLCASNIKRLKAVELQLDDNKNLIMITGKNAQGKSSLLDSIWYALGGKGAAPDKPIRKGEDKGEIIVNVEGWIVTRTFTQKGSYLKVTNKDGELYSNPQEFLDYIIGNLSFDPLAFSRFESKKQVAELTKVAGIDFKDIDQKKAELTEERVLVGRELKTIAKPDQQTIDLAIKNKDTQEISVKELTEKLINAKARHSTFEDYKMHIESGRERIAETEKRILQLQDEIEQFKKMIEEKTAFTDTTENIELLTTQLSTAEETNKTIRDDKRILEDHAKYTDKEATYKTLTEALQTLESERMARLSEVKMPIDGLSWNDDTVLFNGIPFNQLSGAEQLKVSMAIAMASNPKLRVILIRDGSLLDQDNLKAIEEMAKEKDWQIWLEKIDDSGKVGIYIEEGEIKSIN